MNVADATVAAQSVKRSRVRYFIVFMLFVVTAVNYADRATMSMVGSALTKQFHLSPVTLGFIFSAFSWSYVIGQVPGGWLLDRFGSRRVYAASLFIWSLFTFMQGLVGHLGIGMVVSALFVMRFLVGFAEAPSFPGNARIVSAWFPAVERGTASAIFNSAQYFATVMFAPIMGWLIHTYGWPSVFFFMGGLGIIMAFVWLKTVFTPKTDKRINKAELEYLEQGGALVNLDQPGTKTGGKSSISTGAALKQLVSNRMLLGIYGGQFCINALTYFFLTWFPVYLVQARHMSILKAGVVASLPAVFGFLGGILGGWISDFMARKGFSLSISRKTPIVFGMLLSMSMVFCNYVDTQWLVVAFMALAFFGKGIGALGWAVVSDVAPKEIGGLTGGLFNMIGNLSGITTPIIIGYLVKSSGGSFNSALVFIAANALVAVLCYVFVVGDIKRVELKK